MITWFPWPVTALVAVALTAVHLYGSASRSGRPASLALGSVAAFTLLMVPLALSVNAGCTDTGGGVELRSSWLLASGGGAVMAFAVLGLLYSAAGLPSDQAVLFAVAIMAATGVGLLVEYAFSLFSLAVYCEDGSLSVLYGELIFAVLVAMLGGWSIHRRLL